MVSVKNMLKKWDCISDSCSWGSVGPFDSKYFIIVCPSFAGSTPF